MILSAENFSYRLTHHVGLFLAKMSVNFTYHVQYFSVKHQLRFCEICDCEKKKFQT